MPCIEFYGFVSDEQCELLNVALAMLQFELDAHILEEAVFKPSRDSEYVSLKDGSPQQFARIYTDDPDGETIKKIIAVFHLMKIDVELIKLHAWMPAPK